LSVVPRSALSDDPSAGSAAAPASPNPAWAPAAGDGIPPISSTISIGLAVSVGITVMLFHSRLNATSSSVESAWSPGAVRASVGLSSAESSVDRFESSRSVVSITSSVTVAVPPTLGNAKKPRRAPADAASIEHVQHSEGGGGESGEAGLHALIARNQVGDRAVFGAVVDQVEVAEDAVDDRRDRPHHLVADDR